MLRVWHSSLVTDISTQRGVWSNCHTWKKLYTHVQMWYDLNNCYPRAERQKNNEQTPKGYTDDTHSC